MEKKLENDVKKMDDKYEQKIEARDDKVSPIEMILIKFVKNIFTEQKAF